MSAEICLKSSFELSVSPASRSVSAMLRASTAAVSALLMREMS